MPIYLRGLQLLSLEDQQSISSKILAEFIGTNAWQIRKDFSYFGDFGTPGRGYDIKKLQKRIRKILNLDKTHKAALVGVGNLGSAILSYPGFKIFGCEIAAALDSNPKKIGKTKGGIKIENINNINSLKRRNIDIGIIAVPSEVAQQTADLLVKSGVRSILNFSSRHLDIPKKVKVISIDIAMELARLPYYMPSS